MSIATIGNKIVEKSSSDGVPLENKTIHTPSLHSKLGCLFLSSDGSHKGKTCNEGVREGKLYFSFFSWKHVRAKPNVD